MAQHLLQSVRELMADGNLRTVVLVTQYDGVEALAKDILTGTFTVVRNTEPELGISHSINLGLSEVLRQNPVSNACLFTVADQPQLRSETMRQLIQAWERNRQGIVAPAFTEQTESKTKEHVQYGNPVIFDKQYYSELLALKGDRGGKRVLMAHLDDVISIPCDRSELVDVDSRSQLLSFADGYREIYAVGAGGKTTLLYELGLRAMQQGKNVLLTTATHIMPPDAQDFAHFGARIQSSNWKRTELPIEAADKECARQIERWTLQPPCRAGCFDVVGFLLGQKLGAVPDEMMAKLKKDYDLILVEADGARMLPLKMPREHEPVIPMPQKATQLVVGCAGLRAIGQTFSDACLNYEAIGAGADDRITRDAIVSVLSRPDGARKNVNGKYAALIHTQGDDALISDALWIQSRLQEQGITAVVL